MSSCAVKKVNQEQLDFEMKWTKGQSINQGHCAISVGKKAIIKEYVPLELWLAPLVAKLNGPT